MILDKILSSVPGVKQIGGSGWYYFPKCLSCGREWKMCFKDPAGFKCWSAHCGVKGSIPQLIRLLRKAGYNIDIPVSGMRFKSSIVLDKPTMAGPVSVPLPKEMIRITHKNIPTYLTRTRNISARTILRFEMGYCETGRYRGRIIIPLRTDGHRSFIAYSTTGRAPKVLYPKHCQMNRFLFPYNYIALKRPRKVVLVEGVMDALRILEHGHEALPLAMLGSVISSHQIWLLLNLMTERATDITVCLDSDANGKAEKVTKKISSTIGYSQLYQMRLSATDPDIVAKIAKRKQQPVGSIDPDDIYDKDDWAELFHKRIATCWIRTME